jgi:hypothetical protein
MAALVKPRRTQYKHMFSASVSNSDIAQCNRHVPNMPNFDGHQRRSLARSSGQCLISPISNRYFHGAGPTYKFKSVARAVGQTRFTEDRVTEKVAVDISRNSPIFRNRRDLRKRKDGSAASSVNIPTPVGQFLFSAPSNFTTEDKVGSCSTEPGDGACCPCAPSRMGKRHIASPKIANVESGTRIGFVSSLQPTPPRCESHSSQCQRRKSSAHRARAALLQNCVEILRMPRLRSALGGVAP